MIHQDVGEGKREVEIIKSIIDDSLSDNPKLNITEKDLNSYFIPFAKRVL